MQLSSCFPHLDLVYVILLHQVQDQIFLLFLFLIEIAKIQTLFVSSRSLKQSFPFSILIKSLSLSLIGGSQTDFEDKILLHGHSMKMKLLREEDGKYDQPDEI
jgi:uncharacterized membrane protein